MTSKDFTTKQCSKCSSIKSMAEFKPSKTHKDGCCSWCKKCHANGYREFRRTKTGLAHTIYHRQVKTSKTRGHSPPSYSMIELEEWLLAQQLFNKIYSDWVDSNYNKNLTPSVDRKNDYISYTINNIQLMTWRENYKKAHADKRNRVNTKQLKPVSQINNNGIIVESFMCARDATKKTGVSYQNIWKCCTGRRPRAGGYMWAYAMTGDKQK